MLMYRLRRNAILAFAALSIVGSSGCFGSFHLVRKVWQFNKDVSKDKFVQELVFLVLGVIPVYGVAGLLDELVVNSIEFWTGENPVSLTRTIQRDDHTKVVETRRVVDKERVMVLEVYRGNTLDRTMTMRHVPGTSSISVETRYSDGRVETRTATKFEDGTTVVLQN